MNFISYDDIVFLYVHVYIVNPVLANDIQSAIFFLFQIYKMHFTDVTMPMLGFGLEHQEIPHLICISIFLQMGLKFTLTP